MTSIVALGQLQRVELREAWPHEASNFTPWLAQQENLDLLGEALGLELALEAVEKPVDTFSADILARDISNDRWVLIENQLEQTDHTHLGQILTYAAGLDAHTIVWIAKNFREPHRAAIDYLNRISAPEFNFFGIQIELLRIGESALAPRFNLVAKPNDWSKEVFAKATSRVESSGTAQRWQAYWTEFFKVAHANGLSIAAKTPPKERWCRIVQLRRGAANAAAWLDRTNVGLKSLVWIHGPSRLELFDEVFANREQIEEEVGAPIFWDREEQSKSSFFGIKIAFDDGNNIGANDEQQQFDWFVETIRKLIEATRPHLRAPITASKASVLAKDRDD